ncbi:hypothetical protein L6251_01685, partial [Candidatus Parcubacteria bacterium]|nr:hypothetical protein [Candidatus Parcubacteria bacterium]
MEKWRKFFWAWIAFLFFLFLLTLLNAEAAEKKYLKIGADPLQLERPLGSGEKFFSLSKDTFIVSKGKKKISRGWVHAGEVVAVKKNPDGRWKAVWIKRCGNEILNEIFLGQEIEVALAAPLTSFAPSAVPCDPCEELEAKVDEIFFINQYQTQVWGEFKSLKEKKEMKAAFEISLFPDFFSVARTEWIKISSSERGLCRVWGNFFRLKEGAEYYARMIVLADDLVCVSQTISFSRPKLLDLGEEPLPYYYEGGGYGYYGGYGGAYR